MTDIQGFYAGSRVTATLIDTLLVTLRKRIETAEAPVRPCGNKDHPLGISYDHLLLASPPLLLQCGQIHLNHYRTEYFIHLPDRICEQACRYLVKDFGTSESPKSTRLRDSRYAPTV
ncbi:MAG: hypothetical protein KZQ65_09960, partial [Candidatus Thiodiazotropha sp. (ex Gloverina cf. vestifex)]|nr:hypothetical protein [Candidatus Thiodiazotropha sp. (ex Gloverina cf. vestifex)]